LLARRDPRTQRPRKRQFGGAVTLGFKTLRRLRVLRGTPLDPFGYMAHRRMERSLVRDYAGLVDEVLARLTGANVAAAEAVLRAHDKIRGYDIVKEQSVERVRQELPALLEALRK
jgi:indolepyruvate ferredoxin oxidoreductase